MPLRVLIVDDETPARDRLARLLTPYLDDGTVGVLDQAQDGVDALAIMEVEAAYDLVFLDVRMPELDGFDVLDRLGPDHRPGVVFTTAYDEYAVRAFEANAVDYLLKPVDPARLDDAVGRAQEASHGAEERVERLASLLEDLDADQAPVAQDAPPLTQFTVQAADRLVVVRTEEIVSAEVQDGITNLFVLPSGSSSASLDRHIVGFTLDTLHGRLDADRFMRVHRGAIVALEHIRELVPWFSGRYRLGLTGGHEVIASRARSRELREKLSL